MLPDRVSNPGPLTYESGALPIALRGPAKCVLNWNIWCMGFISTWLCMCMKYTQWAFGAKLTSYPRRCDVITPRRRGYDVILAPNAYWVAKENITYSFLK